MFHYPCAFMHEIMVVSMITSYIYNCISLFMPILSLTCIKTYIQHLSTLQPGMHWCTLLKVTTRLHICVACFDCICKNGIVLMMLRIDVLYWWCCFLFANIGESVTSLSNIQDHVPYIYWTYTRTWLYFWACICPSNSRCQDIRCDSD